MKANEALRVAGSITYKGWILTDVACNEMERISLWGVFEKKSIKDQSTPDH